MEYFYYNDIYVFRYQASSVAEVDSSAEARVNNNIGGKVSSYFHIFLSYFSPSMPTGSQDGTFYIFQLVYHLPSNQYGLSEAYSFTSYSALT